MRKGASFHHVQLSPPGTTLIFWWTDRGQLWTVMDARIATGWWQCDPASVDNRRRATRDNAREQHLPVLWGRRLTE